MALQALICRTKQCYFQCTRAKNWYKGKNRGDSLKSPSTSSWPILLFVSQLIRSDHSESIGWHGISFIYLLMMLP